MHVCVCVCVFICNYLHLCSHVCMCTSVFAPVYLNFVRSLRLNSGIPISMAFVDFTFGAKAEESTGAVFLNNDRPNPFGTIRQYLLYVLKMVEK